MVKKKSVCEMLSEFAWLFRKAISGHKAVVHMKEGTTHKSVFSLTYTFHSGNRVKPAGGRRYLGAYVGSHCMLFRFKS